MAGLLACTAAAATFAVAAGAPWVLARLGPASPDLNPVERTALTVYLAASLGTLDAPAGILGPEIEFAIAPGETAAEIAGRLEATGIVRKRELLTRYLRYRGLDTTIEAGSYRLSGSFSIREIADRIQSGRDPSRSFTVIEGWRREEIAEALVSAGFRFSAEAFLQATSSGVEYDSDIPPGATLEGYLFPDTYALSPEASPEEIARTLFDTFRLRLTAEISERFARQGLGLHESVTLASIVEREAAVSDERPWIASVFLNRLRLGMRLEADPTVQFALGRQPDGSWWKSPLELVDLESESPYNTYGAPGLPPGPIANPGLASLTAVAFPAESDYLFFRLACDGSRRHVFSRSLEEHQAQACP
jgi:UPF0755 protein